MSRRESYRTQRWRLLVSFSGGRSPLLQTCLQAQNAPATMQATLNLTCFTHDCSADVYCQVGAGTVVESPLRGAKGPTPDDEESLAVALSLNRAISGLHACVDRLIPDESLLPEPSASDPCHPHRRHQGDKGRSSSAMEAGRRISRRERQARLWPPLSPSRRTRNRRRGASGTNSAVHYR